MDHFRLVSEQTEAGRQFAKLFGETYPVDVAFWAVPQDEDRWHFYLASPAISRENSFDALRHSTDLLRGELGGHLDPRQIRCVPSDSRAAQAVAAFRSTAPSKLPVRDRDVLLGDLPVEEVYIHPAGEATAVPA